MRKLLLHISAIVVGVMIGHWFANWKKPEPAYDIKCYYQEQEMPCPTTPA